MKTSRILVVSSGFPKAPTDGNFTFIGDHCAALQGLGFDVEVLAYDLDTSSDAPVEPSATLQVYRSRRMTLEEHIWRVISRRPRIPGGVDLASFDHVSTQTEVGLPVLGQAKRLSGGRCGTSVVMQGVPAVGLKAQVWKWIIRRDRLHVDDVFVVGASMRPDAKRLYGVDSAALLPNGARLMPEPSVGIADEFHRSLAESQAEGAFLFACVAVLSSRKGIDVLLHALAQVRASNLSVKCLIVGDGAEAAAFQALADRLGLQSVATFMGRLDRGRVHSVLKAADGFILPSRREPYGVAAAEAALASCVILVSDQVGAQPSADASGHWLIHRAGSVQHLARDIRWCVEHPTGAAALAEGARASAEVAASWERNAERFVESVGLEPPRALP